MRLVFWNCNMALHAKLPALAALRPDVAVISECATPKIVRQKAPLLMPDSATWIGQNPQKGLGILGFGEYGVALDPAYDASLRFVAPVSVAGPLSFNLLGVWAQHSQRPAERGAVVGPLLKALDRYDEFIRSSPTVIGGDFNNHVVFDKPGKANNHMNVVARLESLDLFSAYHHDRQVAHGQEPEPTHYWRDRTKDGRTYHLDYCFLPKTWQTSVRGFRVGTFEEWISQSDHVPLIVDIDLPVT